MEILLSCFFFKNLCDIWRSSVLHLVQCNPSPNQGKVYWLFFLLLVVEIRDRPRGIRKNGLPDMRYRLLQLYEAALEFAYRAKQKEI